VKESPVPFVVKAALGSEARTELFSFNERTMYRGKDIRVYDEIFVFSSENQGGNGLCAKGVVTSVDRGPGNRLTMEVRPVATARRNLGRRELKPFRDLDDNQPQTEIARKLYRQATNKIAHVSEEAAAFLSTHF
jgi:hypothetical protein